MRRTLIAVTLAGALLAAVAPMSAARDPESCLAVNPAQPKCTFTVTSISTSGVVTGAVGSGDWLVVVKRGKQKFKIQPSSAEPEPLSFPYQIGDKVTATAKSAGSWVLAGHD